MTSPLVARVLSLASDRIVVQDEVEARSFNRLVESAERGAGVLGPLHGQRVALLASPSAAWIQAWFAVIFAGGIVVPLSPLYPAAELGWFADDAGATVAIVSPDQATRAAILAGGRRVLTPAELFEDASATRRASPVAEHESDGVAMLLYTSGTTGKPKGARITHANLAHQAALLRDAWQLVEDDRLLHALPLHHVHGLGISLLNTLLAGGSARMMPRFDATAVWEAIARGDATVWMAVPTMYQRLFEAFDATDAATRARWAAGAARLRLATSGSAALPVTLAARWRELTGAIPLERFGMTEIGVAASNPFESSARRAGSVGPTLPTVESRLVDENGVDVGAGPGELLIRGPSVFAGYFERDDATRAAFDDAGWFKTGDVAERSDDGYVRLLGRTSIDILKSGGYKLSALEIEEALRENEAIAEVAVIGIPDPRWGDRVVAAVVATRGREADCETARVRAWAAERLVAYKIPREVVVLPALPRNAMGKVLKPELAKLLSS